MGFAVKVPGRGNAPGKPQRGDINTARGTAPGNAPGTAPGFGRNYQLPLTNPVNLTN